MGVVQHMPKVDHLEYESKLCRETVLDSLPASQKLLDNARQGPRHQMCAVERLAYCDGIVGTVRHVSRIWRNDSTRRTIRLIRGMRSKEDLQIQSWFDIEIVERCGFRLVLARILAWIHVPPMIDVALCLYSHIQRS